MYGESQFYTPYEQDVPYGQAHNMQNPNPMPPYGMGNESTPQPMGFMPSNQQGYPSLGSNFSNNSFNAPNYAKGGAVSPRGLAGFQDSMRQVQRLGTGRDKILAHISPEEAEMLARTQGGSVNPISGLPEFGWFEKLDDKIHNFLGKNGEGIGKFLGKTLASAAGGMLFGPFGAMLGGAGAGGLFGLNDEKPNFWKGALEGGAHGAAQGFLGPMLGEGLGFNAAGKTGQMLGMGAPKFGTFSGLGNSVSSMFGGSGGSPASQGGGSGLLGGLLGGGSSGGGGGLLGGGLLSNLLLGGAVLGALNAKKEAPKEPSLQDAINAGPRWSADQQPRNVRATERALLPFDPNNYRPGFEPERVYFSDVNPPVRYASGGQVHAFQGKGGGQSDKIHTGLPVKGYVLDASTVSDLGDGNSDAGAENVRNYVHAELKHNYKKGGRVKNGLPMGKIPAMVSPKEVYIEPEAVAAIGNGNVDKGAKKLEKMVQNVRKHKRSNPNGLPPKAKSIQSYVGRK